MFRSIYTFLLLLLPLVLISQYNYWQQAVEYTINAQIDTSHHTLKAKCDITYKNNSPDTLDRIYIHLWANAFSNKSTPFADQAIQLGMTEFHFADENQLGGYENLKVNQSTNGKPLELIYEDEQNEIAYIPMDGGLAPGSTVSMSFEYTLQIPNYFSRLGKSDHIYNMVAWYPKPAVYDQDGWHTFPYLSMGEFFSEYGTYDVTLRAPENYIISHSGEETERPTENGYVHLETQLENAHDFAWFASPEFVLEEEKVKLENQIVNVKIYRNAESELWNDAMKYTKQVLTFMSEYMGDYPYSTLSIVQGEDAGLGGAMEYPSIKIIKNVKSSEALEYYIAHEVAHSWFYAALGSNERDESYFDEGLATFLEQKYTANQYDGANYQNKKLPKIILDGDKPFLRHFTEGQICRHMHQPLTTPVTELSAINYGLNAYQIGSTLIAHLESLLGYEKVRDIIRSFYAQWKYKHPSYEDLLLHIETESGLDLKGYQDILAGKAVDMTIEKIENSTIYFGNKGEATIPVILQIELEDGSILNQKVIPEKDAKVILTQSKIKSAILDPDQTSLDINPENNRYPRPGLGINIFPRLDRSDKKDIYLSPLVGYNSYDGIMLGLTSYNSTFPAKNLKWNITPFYGLQSKNLVGQSWISYDTRPKSDKIKKIQYRIGVKSFTLFRNDENDNTRRYLRIDPSISIHHNHSPASRKYSKTTLRQLWVGTEALGEGITGLTQNISRLTHNRYNFDVLQPNELEVELEYNRYKNSLFPPSNYLKLSLDYRHGFLFKEHKRFDVRFFAAGFLKNTKRESSTYNDILTRGSIALLSQGFTDYSYDDYFLDRQGQGTTRAYRQIGFHGGGFKDALGSADDLGQSNDFAMAINLKSHLPFGPPKLPLKLFFDTGYARTKSFGDQELTGELFYSGGVMFEISDGLLGIYLPLIASNNISDNYVRNNRSFLSRITFSMDLHRFNPWDLVDDYNF